MVLLYIYDIYKERRKGFLGQVWRQTLRRCIAQSQSQLHCRAKPVATKDAAELRSVAYEVFGNRKHKLAP